MNIQYQRLEKQIILYMAIDATDSQIKAFLLDPVLDPVANEHKRSPIVGMTILRLL